MHELVVRFSEYLKQHAGKGPKSAEAIEANAITRRSIHGRTFRELTDMLTDVWPDFAIEEDLQAAAAKRFIFKPWKDKQWGACPKEECAADTRKNLLVEAVINAVDWYTYGEKA